MNKRFQKAIEISKAMVPEFRSGQNFHTSFAMLRNKIIAIGINDYNQDHLYHLFGKYENYKNYPTEYKPSHHSECDMIKKLLKLNVDFKKLKIFNVRIDNNGCANMASPCLNCMEVLYNHGLYQIYFTINDNNYGSLNLNRKL